MENSQRFSSLYRSYSTEMPGFGSNSFLTRFLFNQIVTKETLRLETFLGR